jgi:ATP-dependent Clp protease protease subunit
MVLKKLSASEADLTGDINYGEWSWENGYVPKDPALSGFQDFLKENKGKTAYVYLTSPGGDYWTGQVFSAMVAEHGKVTLTLQGTVASAATLMLVANRVEMHAGANVMIHRIQGGGYGTSEDINKISEHIAKLDNSVVDTLTDLVGYRQKLVNGSWDETREKIKSLYDAETWLTAQEAYDLGFVDKIIPATKYVPATAVSDRATATAAPSDVNAYYKGFADKPEAIVSAFQRLAQSAKNRNKPESTADNTDVPAGFWDKVQDKIQSALQAIKTGFEDSFMLAQKAQAAPAPKVESETQNISSPLQPENEMTKEETELLFNQMLTAKIEPMQAQITASAEELTQAKKALADAEEKAKNLQAELDAAAAEKNKQKEHLENLAAQQNQTAGKPSAQTAQLDLTKPLPKSKEGLTLAMEADTCLRKSLYGY